MEHEGENDSLRPRNQEKRIKDLEIRGRIEYVALKEPSCLVQAITRHTCPDPHLGS